MEVSVSRQMCRIVASSSKLAQVLGAILKSLNFKVCASVKNLGHGISQQAGKSWSPPGGNQVILEAGLSKISLGRATACGPGGAIALTVRRLGWRIKCSKLW
eukprot:666580-Pyramimonas_sp.AAC.1